MPNIDSQVNANTAQQQNDVSSQLTEIAGRGTRFSLGAQRLALHESSGSAKTRWIMPARG